MRRSTLLLTVALATAPIAIAAEQGGHGAHGGHDMSHMEDLSRFGEPCDPAKADRTVTVKATEMAYDVAAIELKAGETVTFVLVNDGTQSHELGIGDVAYFESHRQMMAGMSSDHGTLPNNVVARMGETVSFAWTFTKPGRFQFACSMPGHSELGMVGTIIVR